MDETMRQNADDKPYIVVVEAETTLRRLLEYRLSKEGYEARSAGNGEASLDLILTRPPDLILSDLIMPRLFGTGLKEELNVHNETARIPFIILTASTRRYDLEEAKRLGVSAYLRKPFDIQELLKVIVRFLASPDLPFFTDVCVSD